MVRKRSQWNKINHLLTQVVQSDKYDRSRAVGVTSEAGLTTDRCPFRAVSLSASASVCRAWETRRLLYFRDTGSPWYEPLYNSPYHDNFNSYPWINCGQNKLNPFTVVGNFSRINSTLLCATLIKFPASFCFLVRTLYLLVNFAEKFLI